MVEASIPGESRHPALALANTALRRHGEAVDLVAEPAIAARWLAERLAERPTLGGAELSALRELRTAIRGVFDGRLAGERPAERDLEVINRGARLAPVVPVLRWDAGAGAGGRLARAGELAAMGAFERVLAGLAGDAIDLVTGEEPLAACGAPDCIRFLVRNHGKRQWCSTRCGDRVRAARHYARTRRS